MFNNVRSLAAAVLLAVLFITLVSCSAPQSTIATIQPSNTPVPPTSTPVGPTPTPLPTVRPTSDPSVTLHLERGQITSPALADNLIGDPATRDFLIYLPPSYDTSEKHYPVVYMLHGFEEDMKSYMNIALYLNRMIVDGEAEEMIFVFVDGTNQFGGSWYLSSPTIGDYESYIVRDLVEHIDANYRTLPDRASRGITGCSMGGDGSLHLALSYPDVFSVAVPMSGGYIGERGLWWDKAHYFRVPEDLADFGQIHDEAQYYIAGAAAAASDPVQPPFYLDMPFEEIDGETQIVQEVYEKINAVYPINDIDDYLDQPVRLRGLLIYHGEYDRIFPVEAVRDFDEMLSELGVEHEYLEVKNGHCTLDYTPVLSFLSDHLVFR